MRLGGGFAGLGLVVVATAGAAPTDIVAVDEFIDAPRALFGRSRSAVEATLGTPGAVGDRLLDGGSGRGAEVVDELRYPGLVIGLSRRSAGLRRVEITEPRWMLPRGLNVGTPRDQVERRLGEPQLATDASALYLYSDAYPDTVEFYFRGGRIHRIEWLYAPLD